MEPKKDPWKDWVARLWDYQANGERTLVAEVGVDGRTRAEAIEAAEWVLYGDQEHERKKGRAIEIFLDPHYHSPQDIIARIRNELEQGEIEVEAENIPAFIGHLKEIQVIAGINGAWITDPSDHPV